MISLKTNSGIYGINKSFSTQYYDNSLQFRQIHCLNSDFDNLFLLPKCAFASHKKIYLRRDLARYNFNINIVADTPKGNVWISGNKETTNMQQQCRPGSANKETIPLSCNTLHWFGMVGDDMVDDRYTIDTSIDLSDLGGEHYQVQRDREERIKQLKEKQNEERQRKLEELKAQALATQKLREQKEEERRRRIDDLKSRDNDKRQQVEERKKAIWEAEKERREYILRKNQERDQRLETKKKNERSQIAFAFGSSTPRMLDSECGSIWAYRRANSIQNVCTNTSISPVTRRSSERELNEGSKKRATSASGLDRQSEGLRSGEMTPKSISNSRPGSAMSSSTTNSAIVNKRTTPVRKARPVSIAVTGVSKDEKSPAPLAPSSASKPIKRTPSAAKSTPAPETPKTKPTSSAKATPKSSTTPSIMSPATEVAPKIIQQQTVTITQEIVVPANDESKNEKTIINNVIKAEQIHTEMSFVDGQEQSDETPTNDVKTTVEVAQEVVDSVIEKIETQENHIETVEVKPEMQESTPIVPQVTQAPPQPQQLLTDSILENTDMTASMIAKTKITTEEEAKAAIAERRRLAREEAERQAEIERKRIEAEEEAERKRQLEEEERHRLMEQEANKLAEEQRRLEEERLQQAIEENKKREEEEQKRKAEEAKQKIEREQAEQRSREEAERAKIETAERLKKEEKEREERRKRVEAIMARTRKGAANTPSKNDESMDLSKSQIELSQSMTENTTAPSTNNESEQSDNNKMDVAKEDEVKEPEKPNQPPQNDYEKSVTEKENLLMSSFNKMNLNSNGLNNNLLETNNNLNLLNGQHVKDTSSDLIISDANIIETTNGHDKNSIENTFNSSELTTTTTEQSSSKPIEDKLIDFGTDAAITNSDQMSTNLNNNNFLDSNSSLITHNLNNNNTNNNNLVAASDMNDERDLSLL
ncbi:ensconsin isoform X11 [Chironomus tepperi]|uniref:ensconsin isoform X11 n=1 Tax=Chironomus tepperi TaxID=113505 RepID=UPI00391F7398